MVACEIAAHSIFSSIWNEEDNVLAVLLLVRFSCYRAEAQKEQTTLDLLLYRRHSCWHTGVVHQIRGDTQVGVTAIGLPSGCGARLRAARACTSVRFVLGETCLECIQRWHLA